MSQEELQEMRAELDDLSKAFLKFIALYEGTTRTIIDSIERLDAKTQRGFDNILGKGQ